MITTSDSAKQDEHSALATEVDGQEKELEQLRRQAVQLGEDKARLESVVAQMTTLLAARDALVEKLNQALKDLRTLKFGKRSEKLAAGQLALAFEDLVLTVASLETQIDHLEAAAAKVSGVEDLLEEKRARRKRDPDEARASLPSHLPVIEEVIEPDSLECPCCKGALHRIGETIAKRLDVVPVQYVVRVTIRPKYACSACETSIVQAPAAAHVVEGGLATEALVAQILVHKHGDHTPIYTQAQAMARQGIELKRHVIASWAGRGAGELKPVWRRMREILLSGSHVFVDETQIPVLDPGRGRTLTGFFWAIAQDPRPYGAKDPPMAVFTYAPGRGGVHARDLLASFSGVAQCDGYNVYKTLAASRQDITLAHCWAHCRRNFFKLLKDDGSTPLVAEGLKRIAAFYAIEEAIRGRSPGERQTVRKLKTGLLMMDFHRWLVEVRTKVMAGSDMGKAVAYALEHWSGLTYFLEDGRVEIDSNVVERAIRPVCLTRKNSLFAGSHGGAENWAIVASLIETCKLNNVNPQAYLTDVLTRIVNGHPNSRIDELMPGLGKLPSPQPPRPPENVSRSSRYDQANKDRLHFTWAYLFGARNRRRAGHALHRDRGHEPAPGRDQRQTASGTPTRPYSTPVAMPGTASWPNPRSSPPSAHATGQRSEVRMVGITTGLTILEGSRPLAGCSLREHMMSGDDVLMMSSELSHWKDGQHSELRLRKPASGGHEQHARRRFGGHPQHGGALVCQTARKGDPLSAPKRDPFLQSSSGEARSCQLA